MLFPLARYHVEKVIWWNLDAQAFFVYKEENDGKSLKVPQGMKHIGKTAGEGPTHRVFRWIADLFYRGADFFRKIETGAEFPGKRGIKSGAGVTMRIRSLCEYM